MIIIPAIDLKDGKVVRLLQGKFLEETVYSHSPTDIAKKWEKEGAELIHVVDLDGALSGTPKNMGIVEEVAKNISIPIELGGGIRTREDIEEALAKGAGRVVLGTKACEDSGFIRQVIPDFPDKIVIGIDAKYEKVATSGWTKRTSLTPIELAKSMQELGIKTIIYTDIARDGTMCGPNIEALKKVLAAVNIDIIASGGISSLEDITALKNLNAPRLFGVIVGRALYEHKFTLKQAMETVK